MFGLLGIVSILSAGVQLIKDACEPTLTAEHWANEKLLRQDRMKGISEKEIIKNVQRGRYYISAQSCVSYPVVHRDSNQKVIIENCDLFEADKKQYGVLVAYQWVNQGKYNLTPKELKIENLRIRKRLIELCEINLRPEGKQELKEIDRILAESDFDCRKTEAVQQWQIAHNAENRYR